MFRQIGPTEIIVILAVVLLLFGGKKLPELARGSGRALRIFKAETKGLVDDEAADSSGDSEDGPKALGPSDSEQESPAQSERRTEHTD